MISYSEVMSGKAVEFARNGSSAFEAYLAVPESGSGRGVLVLQEWWGLVPHIKNLCDRFASAGFVALAPDLYGGEIATEPDTAMKLMMALHIDETERILSRAAQYLKGLPEVTSDKVGIVGFCMGGQLALYEASVNPLIGACVDFYGIHPNVTPKFETLTAPVLRLFADRDKGTSPDKVAGLAEQLQSHGKSYDFVTYENCDHAFFNDTRPAVYNPEAAADAWKRVSNFFTENL